jgi:hypothetical protein
VQQYRRKFAQEPSVIEAVQLTKQNVEEVAAWCAGKEVTEIDALEHTITYVGLNVITWDGMARASEGDYILKDALGDFHIRKPHAFTTTYEPILKHNHNPIQHHDGKPPWCTECGLTAGLREPTSIFNKLEES